MSLVTMLTLSLQKQAYFNSSAKDSQVKKKTSARPLSFTARLPEKSPVSYFWLKIEFYDFTMKDVNLANLPKKEYSWVKIFPCSHACYSFKQIQSQSKGHGLVSD